MSEQINLYQENFHKEKKYLSSKDLLLGIIAGVVLMAGIVGLDVWRLHELDIQLRLAEAQFIEDGRQLAEVQAQLDARQPDTQLVAQVEKLETMIDHQAPLKKMLQQHMFIEGNGYADYFLALARQDLLGMWLTGVRIIGAGQELALQGQMIAPELLPQYLQRLSSELVLAGTEFQLFRMNRTTEDDQKKYASSIEFLVATAEDEEDLMP